MATQGHSRANGNPELSPRKRGSAPLDSRLRGNVCLDSGFPMKISAGKSTPGKDSGDANLLTVTPLKNEDQIFSRGMSGSSLVPDLRRDNPGFRLPQE